MVRSVCIPTDLELHHHEEPGCSGTTDEPGHANWKANERGGAVCGEVKAT